MEGHALMADWTDLDYAVTDVEGNGQQPPDLVEVAVLPITAGSIGEPVSWLVRPPRPITTFAARIHGITDTDVLGAPPIAEIGHEIRAALAGRAIIAHNAHVDTGVLRRELGHWDSPEVFDTLKLARRLLTGQPSYKLGALVKALGLDHGIPPAWYRTVPPTTCWSRPACSPGSLPVLTGPRSRWRSFAAQHRPANPEMTMRLRPFSSQERGNVHQHRRPQRCRQIHHRPPPGTMLVAAGENVHVTVAVQQA
jgi:exodeoxyribonuclease X